ncbi:subtilisin-like serine protease [Sarocladium implicatum]|nr:subtilisin-like serine protease [Sarocladium implicatum]
MDVLPPYAQEHELWRDAANSASLPGYPHISKGNSQRLWCFLRSEFHSDDLAQIADKLRCMAKQDSSSISPLHRQLVKRRTIFVTEDPRLHLVWICDRIFIKPLPRYILSYDFWRDDLDGKEKADLRRDILGYLRTYIHLVCYESDFRIAQDDKLQLLPKNITWEQWCRFREDLACITDDDVCMRYHYGELRLTRLNFYAPFFLGKTHFQRVDYQYGEYFAQFYAPVLFVLAVVSVVLSSLQVTVEVEDVLSAKSRRAMSAFAMWFSVAMMTACWLLLIGLLGLFVYKVAKEWRIALRDRRRLTQRAKRDRTC